MVFRALCCFWAEKRRHDTTSTSEHMRQLLPALATAPRLVDELKAALALPIGPLPVLDVPPVPESKDVIAVPSDDSAAAVAFQVSACLRSTQEEHSEIDWALV